MAKRHKTLLQEIERIHAETYRTYGSPRITRELRYAGFSVSRGAVARIMQRNGIQAKTVKKFKVTTDSNHDLPVAPNILNREFHAENRNEKWVSDITYICTDEGWLYLAGILDLYDGAIVGWSMDSRMKKELVIDALESACIRRRPEIGLLLHSDRGLQYCSEAYQELIEKRGFICSMSRKGNCWDNAPMESFWGKLKTEWLNEIKFRTRAQAKQAVYEYIELFYNRRRLRSTNDYIAPLNMEDAV